MPKVFINMNKPKCLHNTQFKERMVEKDKKFLGCSNFSYEKYLQNTH